MNEYLCVCVGLSDSILTLGRVQHEIIENKVKQTLYRHPEKESQCYENTTTLLQGLEEETDFMILVKRVEGISEGDIVPEK